MGVWILYDDENDRAVLYDSVTETPLPIRGFAGPWAREAAECYLAWHQARFQSDPRVASGVDLMLRPEGWSATPVQSSRDEFDALGRRDGCDHEFDWERFASEVLLPVSWAYPPRPAQSPSELLAAIDEHVRSWRDGPCAECARLRPLTAEEVERACDAVDGFVVFPTRSRRS